MEALHRLQTPGLSLLAFFKRPHDWFVIGSQDQSGSAVRNFYAVAARFVEVEKKGLLDRVLMGTGFDMDAVLQGDIGGYEHFFTAIDRVGNMVKSPGRSR